MWIKKNYEFLQKQNFRHIARQNLTYSAVRKKLVETCKSRRWCPHETGCFESVIRILSETQSRCRKCNDQVLFSLNGCAKYDKKEIRPIFNLKIIANISKSGRKLNFLNIFYIILVNFRLRNFSSVISYFTREFEGFS